jgi:hypothetical protein
VIDYASLIKQLENGIDGLGFESDQALEAATALRDLQAKLAEAERDALKLRKALNDEREMARLRQYPEPFRVGAVYTQRGNVRYMLPIIHQWNEWPDIALEVGFIDAALALGERQQEGSDG